MHLSSPTEAGSTLKRLAGNFLCQLSIGLFFLVPGMGAAGSPIAATSPEAPERIVAVGDVHGDFDDFCLILKRTRLVDDQNHWIGGRATFVQTGDLIDRGAKGRQVMDLMMALQDEATKAGGEVVPLLGNHEVMNILGDLRYVTPANYAAFADSESEKRRKAGYQEYAAWAASHEKLLAAVKQPALPGSEEEWMAAHPAGFLEYREAFSPDGKYGKWIRQHAAVTKIGGVIFLHGGIAPAVTSMSPEEINSQVRDEIQNFDKTMQELESRKVVLPFFTIREIALAVQLELLQERSSGAPSDPEYHNALVKILDFNHWLCMRDDGPLWFRGYDGWSEEEGAQQIPKILTAHAASHIVVAHTVQRATRIRSRFDGRVFLIDTGMLSTYWPGGRASALQIEKDGKITAQYVDGQEVLLEAKHAASRGKPN